MKTIEEQIADLKRHIALMDCELCKLKLAELEGSNAKSEKSLAL